MAPRKAAAHTNKFDTPQEQVVHELSQRCGGAQALQRYLVRHTIDELSSLGQTCLHLACRAGGALNAVKLLLHAGADPNISMPDGTTPLMLAQSADIATCLLDNGADIEKVCSTGSTLLKVACGYGGLPVVRLLLERGAQHQILMRSKGGFTALSAAIALGEEPIAMLLLEQLFAQPGFDVNHPSNWPVVDQPLLAAAAGAGMLNVADSALQQGAAVNTVAPNGCTALMNAVAKSQAVLAGLLCRRGANMYNWRVGSSKTNALDIAVSMGDLQTVKQLLACGADVNAVCEQAQPVVLQAIEQYDTLEVLLSAGAVLSPAVQYSCLTAASSRLDDTAAARTTKLLLPHCSSFDVEDPSSKSTALMQAVSYGKLLVARVLRAAGADLHRRDSTGTAMHYAAISGSIAVVKWLQSLGLDPREAGGKGLLPLHIACHYKHTSLCTTCLTCLAPAVMCMHSVLTDRQCCTQQCTAMSPAQCRCCCREAQT
jgi:ankyrin repeat protein